MLDPRLRHLVAVASTGSFTSGAQSAGVTQSAVTKSIADLERELGYAIFQRTARGAVLTERGAYFAERAAMLLEDTRDLMDPDARRRDMYSGVLRIGVAPASLEWCVIEALVQLRKDHQQVRVELSGGNFDRVIQQLRGGAVDVAIATEDALSGWPDLRVESFGNLETAAFVRKGHPLTCIPNASRSDLAAYDFISPSESRPYGETIRAIYTDQGIPWQHRVHMIDYFPAVKRLVATSDAIGVVAASYAAREEFRAKFVFLPELELFPWGPLACGVRTKWEAKPATRAFIAAMRGMRLGSS